MENMNEKVKNPCYGCELAEKCNALYRKEYLTQEEFNEVAERTILQENCFEERV